MKRPQSTTQLGNCPIIAGKTSVTGAIVEEAGKLWYRISNYDAMEAFFMTLTNPGNLWFFISSTGGFTAGRIDRDHALFPYTTDDRVRDGHVHSGSITQFLVGDAKKMWQPLQWNTPGLYETSRNIYKSELGDALIFEEINSSLELVFRLRYETSPRFGIVRHCSLKNLSDTAVEISYLDGLRNILPSGAQYRTQESYSNLLDAYKRSELEQSSRVGVYALSATLTDQAEPSEKLLANVLWSYGLQDSLVLLSDDQIPAFSKGYPLTPETDILGQRGAYIINGRMQVDAGGKAEWGMVGDVDFDHSKLVSLIDSLNDGEALLGELRADIALSSTKLAEIIEAHDGNQIVGSPESAMHHKANILFNLMRGGYFSEGYKISRQNFRAFVRDWNAPLAEIWDKKIIDGLPLRFSTRRLRSFAEDSGDPDLHRLSMEYLPLTFSRRHGDPSRPWNMFSIRTMDADGKPAIGYQGNWRDIFQNWEALSASYPGYLPQIITKFLNATTIDGYNPYRISQHGVDWEAPEPDDPWGNIGYWSDHQIVYLSRLLEQLEHYLPGTMADLLAADNYVFPHVPYRIAGWQAIRKDPYNTISFDENLHRELIARSKSIGADGKLLLNASGVPLRVGCMAKLLILFLAKLGNYVPGGGIWMNTQRPEWNDANNALAGWGLSMVTLYYLQSYIDVILKIMDELEVVSLPGILAEWLETSASILEGAQANSVKDPSARYRVLSALGTAASAYREQAYGGISADNAVQFSAERMASFFNDCRRSFGQTIAHSMREDGTFESYQILRLEGDRAMVERLYPMLEGQVAGLSLHGQDPEALLRILDKMKSGPLYREDQKSYMLYPNRRLPGFLSKNRIRESMIREYFDRNELSALVPHILTRDCRGDYHFPGHYRNAKDLKADSRGMDGELAGKLQQLFEETFHHSAFTGRSGTFFAYEGLGSIYWHMVSKLLLAVQERLVEARLDGEEPELLGRMKSAYADIRRGLGFVRNPKEYGAFPTDPYSHTPWGRGARQPGMTGQVKEEVLTRPVELGAVIRKGKIVFLPELILDDQWREPEGRIGFSICGVPVTIKRGDKSEMVIHRENGVRMKRSILQVPSEVSREIFWRSGSVLAIDVQVKV